MDNEVSYATMSPGEALFVLGSTWHAGGANKTKDVRRPQNTFFFTRGMYRPEVCHLSIIFKLQLTRTNEGKSLPYVPPSASPRMEREITGSCGYEPRHIGL